MKQSSATSESRSKKESSDEVDETQLERAKKAGDAYQEALEYMVNDVAHAGGKTEAGDYIVGFAQEEAEGMYALAGESEFEWREPDDENCHVGIAVCDAEDGRDCGGRRSGRRVDRQIEPGRPLNNTYPVRPAFVFYE
jgi:hypothetical protein